MSTIAPIVPNEATTTSAANAAKTAAALAEINKKKQALGKDDFLKLLIAQLKNQDPQQPADSAQMAAQLAQFTSVEQLTNISKTLETQQGAQNSLLNEITANGAVNNIGRVITANSDLLELTGSGTETLSITGNGGPATLTISDPKSGRTITTRSLGSLAAGTSDLIVGRALQDLPAGVYRVSVTSDAADSNSAFTTAVRGLVSGLETENGTLSYSVGRLRIPLSAVTAISSR